MIEDTIVWFAGLALSDDQLLLLSPEELCKDRLSDEYFRLKADSDGGDCRDVVRLVDVVRSISDVLICRSEPFFYLLLLYFLACIDVDNSYVAGIVKISSKPHHSIHHLVHHCTTPLSNPPPRPPPSPPPSPPPPHPACPVYRCSLPVPAAGRSILLFVLV